MESLAPSRPAWAPSGRELFYLDQRNRLTAVSVPTAGLSFIPGAPRTVLDTGYFADALDPISWTLSERRIRCPRCRPMPGEPKAKRRPRRRVTDEFQAQTVRLILDEGRSIAAVARDLDLVPSPVTAWVRQARADRTSGRTGLTTAEREELTRLRNELRIAQEGARHPKKATAFFAKQNR